MTRGMKNNKNNSGCPDFGTSALLSWGGEGKGDAERMPRQTLAQRLCEDEGAPLKPVFVGAILPPAEKKKNSCAMSEKTDMGCGIMKLLIKGGR